MSTSSESLPVNAIAVVGMAGRFPGANNVSVFWDNLRCGEESIVTLSEQELRAAGVDDEVLANPAYVRRAPIVDGVDEFDARPWSHSNTVLSTVPSQSLSTLSPGTSNAPGLTAPGLLHSTESQQSPMHVVKPSPS